MKPLKSFWMKQKAGILLLLAAAGGGALLALLDQSGNRWKGWLAGAGLLAAALLLLRMVEQRSVLPCRIILLARGVFWLRLGLGALLMAALPVLGYPDNQASLNGYLFQDAYIRDEQAWALAASPQPLSKAFSSEFSGDQYGGLLALSALTYRLLSPDFHRPALILIWVALAGALGVALLWQALHTWLKPSRESPAPEHAERVAHTAALIYALYPEAVLLGSSHMREPFVMLGIGLVFLGYARLVRRLPFWRLAYGMGAVWLLLFQPPLAFLSIAVTFGLWLIEAEGEKKWKYGLWFVGLAVLALGFLVSVWGNLPALASLNPLETVLEWLRLNFNFQAHLAERASGMMQKLLRTMGRGWTLPIVLGYGAVQPVLPAALVDPAVWIWRLLNTLRAAGWYLLAPVLAYGMLTAVRTRQFARRRQVLWLSLVCLGWILVVAAAAGGDQWDNPRYRTLFLPWMAYLAGWAWVWAKERRDPWLKRFWIAEAIFVIMFLEWYISRYYPALFHLDVRLAIALTLFAMVGFLVLSQGWDLYQRKRKK